MTTAVHGLHPLSYIKKTVSATNKIKQDSVKRNAKFG